MNFTKISSNRTTFTLRFAIFLGALQVVGCIRPSPIPEERYRQANDLVDVGTGFLREQDLVEARKAFELASELAPVAAAVDGLGCVALLEGRYPEADELFTEAYRMDRSYDDALANLGLLREMQGDSEGARRIYQEYLDKNPSSAGVRNNLAALEYDGGMRKMKTVEALEKAITLSDQAVIRDNLVVLADN